MLNASDTIAAAETARAPARRGKHSLNRKLTLIVVASVMAASLVISIGAVWQEAQRHTQGKITYLEATASVFAAASSEAVAESNARDALMTLRGIGRSPDIVYARINRADGAVLAEIGSGVTLDSDARFDGDTSANGSLLDALKSHSIQVSTPIVKSGVEVGSVTLVADNSDLAPRLMETLVQTLLGALAALLVAVLVAARLQLWVVRPLLNLTRMVREIGHTLDYSVRLKVESDDEVGDLCNGVNTMLGEIMDRERRIIELAQHDAETDLPNRLAFEATLAERLAKQREGRMLAVAAIGVDRFQYVRGVIGYHYANDMLSEVGTRALMYGPVAARISTDVIALVFEARSLAHAEEIGAMIVTEVEAPMLLGADPIDIGARVGLAMAPLHGAEPQALIERASIGLDQARAGRAKVAVFDEVAYEETARNLSMMNDMMRSLGNGEMKIHLQPKYDLRAESITGAEVLARWTHPARGPIAPDAFIAMAEDTGNIAVLTHWVLRETIETQARLMTHGIDVMLAVNLSGRLVGDAEFVQAALGALREARGRICIEITETASIDDEELSLTHIQALIDAGAR